MIFSPNSAMRYLAALRIYVSLSILKNGLNAKHLENLRKIFTAEAFLNKKSLQSVDIKKLSYNFFESISAIKQDFKFCCNLYGNFLINKKLFTILLLQLSKETKEISLENNNTFLIIKLNGKIKNLSTLKALKGYSLFEIKNKKTIIIIPTTKTKQKSVEIESEWELLFDKFSVLNIFFTRIL